MKNRISTLFHIFLVMTSLSASEALSKEILNSKTVSPQKPIRKKTAALAPTKPQKPEVQWDEWYTIEANGGIPYGYYNDRFEKLPDGRLHYENRTWKLEEGWINEESLGAYAQKDEFFTPLFFSFWSNYRSSETQVDGTFTDGKQLSVRVRQAEKERPAIKRSIPDKTSLSVLFPVFLGSRIKGAKLGETKTFRIIFEDDINDTFAPKSGSYRLEAPDEFAKKSKTTKFQITSRDQLSDWYVDERGLPIKIIMRASKIIVDRVQSRAVAEAFIRKAPPTDLPAEDAPNDEAER